MLAPLKRSKSVSRSHGTSKMGFSAEKISALQYNGRSVIVWTAGACSQAVAYVACLDGNFETAIIRKAGYGIFFDKHHEWNTYGSLRGAPKTENDAKIEAIIRAVKICSSHGLRKVEICSDSTSLIEGLEKIHKWKKSNWKTSKGHQVENKIKFQKLYKAIASSGIKKISWVQEGNIHADKLAKKGTRQY